MGHPQIYSREYYQRIFDLEERHWWHLGMREIAASLLRSASGHLHCGRVLDVGCGTGGAMIWARDSFGANMIGGVDISFEALEHCHRRLDLLLSQGSALELPFRSDIFDLVICQDVLQHLPTNGSDLHALTEIHRVLRPGGFVLVRANSRLGMWQTVAAQNSDYQRYSLPEIVARIRTVGFITKRATYVNALPAVYASVRRWVQLRSRRRHRNQNLYEGLNIRDTSSRYPRLNRILLSIMRAEALYLSATKRNLPFGHTTFCLGMKPFDDKGTMLTG
jgi:ubiquinone/menaquinone biosynthesis C-methylase UbiE